MDPVLKLNISTITVIFLRSMGINESNSFHVLLFFDWIVLKVFVIMIEESTDQNFLDLQSAYGICIEIYIWA